jgi:creatinine amidohydrolase
VPVDYVRISSRDLGELTLESNVIAVVPLGSVEQHCEGPLGLDSMIAERLAYEACKHLEGESRVTCIILPTISYGYSPEWSKVKGTISIPLHIYTGLLEAVIEGIIRSGVKRIALINAHGGNVGVAEAVLRNIASKHEGLVLALINYWELLNAKLDHAGPFEESVARALGLQVSLGDCINIGYESKPRVILGTPSEPAKIVFEANSATVDFETLVGALAKALKKTFN